MMGNRALPHNIPGILCISKGEWRADGREIQVAAQLHDLVDKKAVLRTSPHPAIPAGSTIGAKRKRLLQWQKHPEYVEEDLAWGEEAIDTARKEAVRLKDESDTLCGTLAAFRTHLVWKRAKIRRAVKRSDDDLEVLLDCIAKELGVRNPLQSAEPAAALSAAFQALSDMGREAQGVFTEKARLRALLIERREDLSDLVQSSGDSAGGSSSGHSSTDVCPRGAVVSSDIVRTPFGVGVVESWVWNRVNNIVKVRLPFGTGYIRATDVVIEENGKCSMHPLPHVIPHTSGISFLDDVDLCRRWDMMGTNTKVLAMLTREVETYLHQETGLQPLLPEAGLGGVAAAVAPVGSCTSAAHVYVVKQPSKYKQDSVKIEWVRDWLPENAAQVEAFEREEERMCVEEAMWIEGLAQAKVDSANNMCAQIIAVQEQMLEHSARRNAHAYAR